MAGDDVASDEATATTAPAVSGTAAASSLTDQAARHRAAGHRDAGASLGEMRQVSVIFIDLVGFTSLAEQFDAEDVREVLSRFYRIARAIIERFGGAIEKYIGDAVMAVWGSPVAREDDAERATRASLEVVRAVGELDEAAASLQARAAVVTGRTLTVSQAGEGMVVGDTVNVAARLQSLAEPGSVLIDDVTRQLVAASIACVERGTHELRGRVQPVRVWQASRVLARTGAPVLPVESLIGELVGRDDEFAVVQRCLDDAARARRPHLLVVTGPAGVGKSRLLRELQRHIAQHAVSIRYDGQVAATAQAGATAQPAAAVQAGATGPVSWQVGRAVSLQGGAVYAPLAGLVRARLALDAEAPPEQAEAQALMWLREAGASADQRAAVQAALPALLGSGPLPSHRVVMAGAKAWFSVVVANGPAVVVFEDLHAADARLLAIVDELCDHVPGPLLVVAVGRDEMLPRCPSFLDRRPDRTVLELQPLPTEALTLLLSDLVERMPVVLATQIVDQAAGLPLYVVESVRALIDRGAIVTHGDQRLFLGGASLEIPPGLRALVAARLDSLGAFERRVLRTLSVLGEQCTSATGEALVGGDPQEFMRACQVLVDRGLLKVREHPPGALRFSQPLVRDVAYDMLSRRDRRRLHLEAAALLRTNATNGEPGPSSAEAAATAAAIAESVADHLRAAMQASGREPDLAQLRTEAIAGYEQAAECALEVGDPDRAARVLAAAAELDANGVSGLARAIRAADAAVDAGRYAAAVEVLTRILASPSEQPTAAHPTAADPAAAGTAAEEPAAQAPTVDVSEAAVQGKTVAASRWMLAVALSELLVGIGRDHDATAVLRQATPAQSRGSPAVLTVRPGLLRLGRLTRPGAGSVGVTEHPSSSVHQGTSVHQGASVQPDPDTAEGWLAAAHHAWAQRRYLDVEAALDRAHGALNHEPGDLAVAPETQVLAFRTMLAQGQLLLRRDLARAHASLVEAVALADRVGDALAQSAAVGALLGVWLRRGSWGELAPRAELALNKAPDVRAAAWIHRQLAELTIRQGRLSEARVHLRALRGWATSHDLRDRATYAALAAMLAAAEGDTAHAAARSATIIRQALGALGPWSEAAELAGPLAVGLAIDAGDLAEAARLLELVDADSTPSAWHVAVATTLRGQLAGAEGALTQARALLERAVDGWQALGSAPWRAQAQGELARVLEGCGDLLAAERLRLRAFSTLRRLGARAQAERVLTGAGADRGGC